MITYQKDTVENVFRDIGDTFIKHHEEVESYTKDVPLDIDREQYEALEAVGALHAVSVRDDGELIGYYVSMVMPHPHHKGSLFAVNDIIYIDPEYRKSGVAAEMILFAENELRGAGVDVMTFSMKAAYPFKSLAKHVGFEETEIVYSKYIGDNG
jgi:GNAT superfamily N-acetyltransferase